MFASSSLAEESVEGIITSADGLVRRHLAIRLDSVFQAEQLPARVTHLNTGLTHMNTYHFSHSF